MIDAELSSIDMEMLKKEKEEALQGLIELEYVFLLFIL